MQYVPSLLLFLISGFLTGPISAQESALSVSSESRQSQPPSPESGWADTGVSVKEMGQNSQPQRPLTVDDLFRINSIGEVAFSPNGDRVAYVQVHSSAATLAVSVEAKPLSRCAEIWIESVASGAPGKIEVDNTSDVDGFASLKWSPDGTRLAAISYGSEGPHLVVWDEKAGRSVKANTASFASSWSLAWLDSDRIVHQTLARKQYEESKGWGAKWAFAGAERYRTALVGREATASTFDTGVPFDAALYPRWDTTVYAVDGTVRRIGAGAEGFIAPSPDGLYFAHTDYAPSSKLIYVDAAGKLLGDRLHIYEVDHILQVTNIDDGVGLKARYLLVPESFQWSRKGHRFAFLGTGIGDARDQISLFRGVAGEKIEKLSIPELDPQQIVWIDAMRFVVLANHKARRNWWLIAPGKEPRNITSAMKEPPATLWVIGKMVIGVIDGEVWRLEPDSGRLSNLTIAFEPNVTDIAWPTVKTLSTARITDRIIVATALGPLKKYYRLDLVGGESRAIDSPWRDGGRKDSEEPLQAFFKIDAQINIPPGGYGLNAVRRFLITFGRRRHTRTVPLAILFGRAAQRQDRVRRDEG